MDNSSQRLILRLNPACEIPEFADAMRSVLFGDGPCLGFGEISSRFAPKQAAFVFATSGSSGSTKEVVLEAASVIASAKASNLLIGAKEGDIWSQLLPLTHIGGANVVVRSILLGTLPIDLRNFQGDYPSVDFTSIVPTQLFKAINGDDGLLNHLREAKKVLVGGALLSKGLRNQAQDLGINVVATYGMTETCGGCIYDGIALDGVEVKVVDKRIYLRGPILALTYLNSPWVLQDGWFATNDLGEIVDGQLFPLGRLDDVIITGGENLSLNAVESSLSLAFPKLQIAAFAIEDLQWGQTLQLAIVGDFTESQISSHLENEFGLFAKPKRLYKLDSLPLLGIGKVDRLTLVKKFSNEITELN